MASVKALPIGLLATAHDGKNVRAAWRPEDRALGTVLLFPRRTEFVEKYDPIANEFADRGFATLTIDWRGQGFADRLPPDRRIGHIQKFPDCPYAVAAMMDVVKALDIPGPFHPIGHSVGGAIGLRAVYEGLGIQTCVFTGPMWGISLSPPLRALGFVLPPLAKLLGASGHIAPTTSYENYVIVEPFEDNKLTSDPEMFSMIRDRSIANPDMALGGFSLNWVREALDEANTLYARPSPKQPGICWCLRGDRRCQTHARPDGTVAQWRIGYS